MIDLGKIFTDFKMMVQEYKEVLPAEVLNIIENSKEEDFPKIPATKEDREKFFVTEYEELSDAIFNLLHSGRGMYIMNYTSEFKVNRKAAGFETVSDLVHYAIWVIETYNNIQPMIKEDYIKLKNKDMTKTHEEILAQLIVCKELKDELYTISMNMKSHEDFAKRLALIHKQEENECLAYRLLTSLSYHKQIDDIYIALSKIENIHLYNIPPKPLKQSFWDSRTV